MTNHRDRSTSELRAALRYDLQRNWILLLRGINDVAAKTCQTFVSDRRRVDRRRQIVCTRNVKISNRQLGQERIWPTPIRSVRNRAQGATGEPRTAAFVACDWSPAAGTKAFPARVDAAADRSGARDHD